MDFSADFSYSLFLCFLLLRLSLPFFPTTRLANQCCADLVQIAAFPGCKPARAAVDPTNFRLKHSFRSRRRATLSHLILLDVHRCIRMQLKSTWLRDRRNVTGTASPGRRISAGGIPSSPTLYDRVVPRSS